MREGSLDAPIRHPLEWDGPEFYDAAALDAETRRVFDICHGCRRCFNLCDSFPRLFDLIDESESGELDTVASKDFKPVIDACTMCDMCFMAKCPYVPPHEFNLDFPHLMLRHRAVEWQEKQPDFGEKQMIQTDRNGKLGSALAPLANAAVSRDSKVMRPVMNKVLGVHQDAELPGFAGKTLASQLAQGAMPVNKHAAGFGRKAVLYATCYGNYNVPEIGVAAQRILAHNGVETELVYPECCGMPQLEKGDIATVAGKANNVAACLLPYVDKGYDVIALVPSCALMLKFEWPLLFKQGNAQVQRLADSSYDISEYIVELADAGLTPGLQPIPANMTVHIACHARAQNMGYKSAELLRLIPELTVNVVERCSGHGGTFGVMAEHFEVAMKIAKPTARQIAKQAPNIVASECPLAGSHLAQALAATEEVNNSSTETPQGVSSKDIEHLSHPVQMLARSYGF